MFILWSQFIVDYLTQANIQGGGECVSGVDVG
jgi:hypothetical protein